MKPVSTLTLGGHIDISYDNVSDLVTSLSKAASTDTAQLLYYGWVPNGASKSRLLLGVIGKPGFGRIEWHFADVPIQESHVPSLAKFCPAAIWLEREMWERTRVTPVGHPDLRPMLHPEQLEIKGVAHGEGVFHLPLGPVRADVAESIYFLFDTIGEQIMHMEPQLFYKHRDIEHVALGQTVEDTLLLAERISGTSTVAHASAFARAVEQALGLTVTKATELERTLFLELERLYNHAHDLAQMASAAGMTVAQAQLSRVKEECLRLNGDLTGSRYLRNSIRLAEPSQVNWEQVCESVRNQLQDMGARLNSFVAQLLKTPTFVDRLQNTGIVKREWARAYGMVGPAARACGCTVDVRQDYLPWYSDLGYELVTSETETGDAYARFMVRVREWQVSHLLIQRVLDRLIHPKFDSQPLPEVALSGMGIGLSESPRGRVAHVVKVNETGKVEFWGIQSASAWNWPVFGLATANGNIQTDFPVIESSFGLSCAGIDR